MGRSKKRQEDWKTEPLAINEHDLPFEFRRQSRLFRYWSIKASNARKEVNETKAKMELVEAELRLRINRRPAKFGLSEKPTLPLIEATVIAHPKYQEAVKAHIDAKYNLDVINSMVEGIQQKKPMLEKEGDFYLAGFFAEPRTRVRDDVSKRSARKSR